MPEDTDPPAPVDPALEARRRAGAARAQRFRDRRRPETITVTHLDGAAIIWRFVDPATLEGGLSSTSGRAVVRYSMVCGCGTERVVVAKCIHEVRACEMCQKNRRRAAWQR